MNHHAPAARRWTVLWPGTGGATTKYSLPCRVSDRIATASAGGFWAIYGPPNPDGVALADGQVSTAQGRQAALRAAKSAARAKLDQIAQDFDKGDFSILDDGPPNRNGAPSGHREKRR